MIKRERLKGEIKRERVRLEGVIKRESEIRRSDKERGRERG